MYRKNVMLCFTQVSTNPDTENLGWKKVAQPACIIAAIPLMPPEAWYNGKVMKNLSFSDMEDREDMGKPDKIKR